MLKTPLQDALSNLTHEQATILWNALAQRVENDGDCETTPSDASAAADLLDLLSAAVCHGDTLA